MPRKAVLLNSLSRGRVRTSFNKYNLFNLYKKGQVDFRAKTLFQQKWTAKQETRAYHGEHLTESRWQSNFEPSLESVAQLDASLRGDKNKPTPISLQTYAALEKRLEFALFRAMFASSVRQARQFILHGNVWVNGVKITQPGYNLKAGDVFSVKPEKVLQALGATKPDLKTALNVDKIQILQWNNYVKAAKANPQAAWDAKMAKSGVAKEWEESMRKQHEANMDKKMLAEQRSTSRESLLTKILSGANAESLSATFYNNEELTKIASDVATKMSAEIESLKGKNETEILEFATQYLHNKDANKDVKQELSKLNTSQMENIRKHYATLKESTDVYDSTWAEKLSPIKPLDVKALAEDEKAASQAVSLPWQKGLYGRQDISKPYFTPWKPRGFLAPFAVLPHHIEVSFKTCHAVYLRDPIARPGHSEVISPFALPVHERAYMYYVRRGK